MSYAFSRFMARPGWIEVIAGCMFSGKTEELLRQLKRAEYAKQKCQVFKPVIDTRYSEDHVMSHDQQKTLSLNVRTAEEILQLVDRNTHVVGIDEGQFFDMELVEVCGELARLGKRVVIAGLDLDWKGQPYEPIPQLMALAEVVRKQYAICSTCGELATRSQRLIADDNDVLLGSTDAYEARCRFHFDPHFVTRRQAARAAHSNSTTTPQELNP